jgi:hypothetical protein
MLKIPGPPIPNATPSLPEARAYPSAMQAAPASCAATTVRTPGVSVIAGMKGSFIPARDHEQVINPSAARDRTM